MNNIRITVEQKNNIINECLSTSPRKTFRIIAEQNNISLETLYLILNEYCMKNGYESFSRTHKGTYFQKPGDYSRSFAGAKKGLKFYLEKTEEIEQWCKENGRLPKKIKGIKVAKKDEEETLEQKELRLYEKYRYIKDHVAKTKIYKNDPDYKEIVKKISKLDYEYKRPKIRTLKNLQELEQWCGENERLPSPKCIETIREGENETPEQEETRLWNVYRYIKYNIVTQYDKKELNQIENKYDRTIVEKFRNIEEKVKSSEKERNRNLKIVQKIGNKNMQKMILNLITTKNATEAQVEEIAKFYGIELGKVINNNEER